MKKTLSIGFVFLTALLMFQTFSRAIGFTDTWYSTTPIPTPHYIHCSVVHGNKIYLVGGSAIDGEPGSSRAHVYYASVQPNGYIDPEGWNPTTSLPDARNFGQNNVLVYENRIYVLGGRANYPPQRIERDTVWFASFNPDGTIGNWNTTTSLPYPVGDIAAVAWNDRIYILGGWDGYGWHDYVYYAKINSDGSLGNWQQSALLPAGAPRVHDHVAVVNNGIIYLIGGQYPINQYPKEVYYAPIESSGEVGAWNETAHFPVEIVGHSALVYGDDIFVIGGGCYGIYYGTVYKAHINQNGSLGSWFEWGILPHQVVHHSSVVLNERVYVIGGHLQDHYVVDTVYFTCMDAESPLITILSPQNITYTTTSVPLTFTVNESTSWIGYGLDGQPNATITGNTTLNNLTEGSHNVIVYANDTCGNMGASDKVFFTITFPRYELTVTSSPMTGITFTINGTPQITPYAEWLLEGSYTLEMPATHDGYEWAHWLEDGDTNRIKTITLHGTIWTGVFVRIPSPPVGGYAYLIETHTTAQPLASYIAIIAIVVTAFTVVRRKTYRRVKEYS